MIITIDKKKIDFTLDSEKQLKEVIENINSWLAESQHIIEKLYINNVDYSIKDLNIDLEEVNTIDVETLSFVDLNINNLSWIKYFFERIVKAIDSWDTKILNQIKEESTFILSHLPSILSLDNSTPEEIYSVKVKEQLDLYNYFQCKEEIVNKNEVNSIFTNIILLINERLNEYTNTLDELKSSITILSDLKKELEQVSVYLQSGKEDKAAIVMTKFTNIFHKILRILSFNLKNSEIVGDNNLEEFTEGLDDILSELLEGYESQDIVLIGDILEYELSPRIVLLENIFI